MQKQLFALVTLLFILVLAIFWSGSGRVVEAQPAGLPRANERELTGSLPPIVLLPGIMGSYLANAPTPSEPCFSRPEGEIWLGLSYLLNPFAYNDRLTTLWLDDSGTGPADTCDHLSASNVITGFSLGIPGLEWDYYQTLIVELQEAGYPVYLFPYDWRLDLEQIAQELDSFMATQIGTSPVVLVGHSLGGLVARQYTLEPARAQNVSKVISVGTPYWGAPAAALHMRKGTIPVEPLNYLLNNNLVRTFHRNAPAVMQILPSPAYFQQTGEAYYMHGSGLLGSYEETTTFFTTHGQNAALLEQATLRHQAIDDFRQALNVPYYVLTTNHDNSAILTVREYSCWFGLNTCWKPIVYGAGDGTVPWASARLSGQQGDWSGEAEVCTFAPGTVSHNHSELLADESVITDILLIMQDLPAQYCLPTAALETVVEEPAGLLEIALHGDATAQVVDSAGNYALVSEEGYVINTIPLSTYQASATGSFIALPAGQTYTLTLQQRGDTPVLLQITDFQSSSLVEPLTAQVQALFVDVPATAGGKATMTLEPTTAFASLELAVDLNSDNTAEYTLSPAAVLHGAELQDFTAPTTTITVEGESNASGFYTGTIQVTVSAIDTEGSVLKSEYSLDGSQTWQRYTEPLTLLAEQVPVFEARSMDWAGNQEYPWAVTLLHPYASYVPFVQR